MGNGKQTQLENLSDTQQERRKFLERAGRLAAYTPPVLLGLMLPGEHAIASGVYPSEEQNGKKKQKVKG
jgi:hypothetical protein